MDNPMIGFCMHCGKILHEPNYLLTPSSRLVCNTFCQDKLVLEESVFEQIRNKATLGLRYSGYLCYASGAVFLFFGLPHLFLHNMLFWLGIFLCPAGIILLVSGYFFVRSAKRK